MKDTKEHIVSEFNLFDWVDFYKELSGILLQYKNNRRELVEKVKKIYETTGINLPTIENDNQIVDIDPFTFFGICNKKLTDANRLSVLKAITGLFDVKAPVPTAFDSIHVLNPQNATFYYFIPDRGERVVRNSNLQLFMPRYARKRRKSFCRKCAANPVKSRKTEDLQHYDKNTFRLPRQYTNLD